MIFMVVVFFASIVVYYRFPDHLQAYANFIGVLGTCLAAVQYLPQIWTTWRLKHVMSLSIIMMCIQTPGSFVWAGSLAARLGPSGWSSWGLFLVTGTLQGCLLAMAISFTLRDRREGYKDPVVAAGHDSSRSANGTAPDMPGPDERTALLGDR